MGYMTPSWDKTQKHAEERGVAIRFPKANELFIDIDDRASRRRFEAAFEVLEKEWEGVTYIAVASPGGKRGHEHIIVTLPHDVTDIERCALQSALGDDPKRGIRNYLRIIANEPNPIVLFERKAEPKRPADIIFPERAPAIASNTCMPSPIGCGKPATSFKDSISKKEYGISGLCQACQDSVFGE